MNHNYFRDYDGTTGRYIQSDPIGLAGGTNTFTYVGSNPLSFVDLLGLQAALGSGGGSLGGAGASGGIGGSRARAESLSRALEAFNNSFEGMFSSPRPRNMTPGQERQFDRHCAGSGDPCKALQDAADKAIAAALPKVDDMLVDKDDMFGGPGWKTHRDGLEGRMNAIADMIALGQLMGCDMSNQLRKFAAVYIPTMPRRLMRQ